MKRIQAPFEEAEDARFHEAWRSAPLGNRERKLDEHRAAVAPRICIRIAGVATLRIRIFAVGPY